MARKYRIQSVVPWKDLKGMTLVTKGGTVTIPLTELGIFRLKQLSPRIYAWAAEHKSLNSDDLVGRYIYGRSVEIVDGETIRKEVVP